MNWAGAYVTTSRLDSSEITAPFHTAPLSLLVKLKEGATTPLQFLKPFDSVLWSIWMAAVFITAFAFVLIEGDYSERPSILSHRKQVKDIGAGMFDGRAFRSIQEFVNSLFSSVYIHGITASGLEASDPMSILVKCANHEPEKVLTNLKGILQMNRENYWSWDSRG